MKVYEFKGFPNPARVRIALAEKGLFDDAEFIQVDVPGGAHKQPEFLAINPSGAVPVLELNDGTRLSECSAITEYLDASSGETTLTGKTPLERGVVHMIQRKVESGFMDAVGTYFHQATDGLGPEIEGPQVKEWGERQRDVAVATMHWMEGQLADRDYLAGPEFTVADITGMAGFLFADFVGLAIPDDCVKLKAWRERVFARPSAAVAG